MEVCVLFFFFGSKKFVYCLNTSLQHPLECGVICGPNKAIVGKSKTIWIPIGMRCRKNPPLLKGIKRTIRNKGKAATFNSI